MIEEIPIPTPEGRDLLVRVQAVSLCHSDVSIVDGIIPNLSLPLTIGHEAISVVESLGPNAASFGFKVGDRIGAPLWHGMCLECISCREQAPEFCPQGKMKGVTTGGYFAEYALVDPASAVHVPDTDLALPGSLAPIFCAGITVWDALRKAKLEPNDTVAIVGVGGLGALAAQYASGMGAKVIALDIHDEQLQNLKSSGHADEIINTALAGPENTPIKFSEVNKGRMADVVLVTTGAVPAYKTALSIVRAEGRLVAVGLPKEEWSINLFTLTMRSIKYDNPRLFSPSIYSMSLANSISA